MAKADELARQAQAAFDTFRTIEDTLPELRMEHEVEEVVKDAAGDPVHVPLIDPVTREERMEMKRVKRSVPQEGPPLAKIQMNGNLRLNQTDLSPEECRALTAFLLEHYA